MTYLIALCDDEAAELDRTEGLLNAYEKQRPELDFMIERFESAEEFLYVVRERNYAPDLIFMDIFMPGRAGEQAPLGMETARTLREIGSRARLFFLTMSKEYALEAFDVDAAQYLVKPVAEDKLASALDRFLQETAEERKKYILLKTEGKLVRVAVNDIVYCEAQGKMQLVYLADGTVHRLRMTMAKIHELLSAYQEFVWVGVAYIVNVEYVDSLNPKEIHLHNGRNVYLPRGAYKALKETYFRFYCGE